MNEVEGEDVAVLGVKPFATGSVKRRSREFIKVSLLSLNGTVLHDDRGCYRAGVARSLYFRANS